MRSVPKRRNVVRRDYMEGLLLTPDREAQLGDINVPTLILWGSKTPSSRAKNRTGLRV